MPATKVLSNADIIRLLELYRVEYDCVVPEDQEQEGTLQRIATAMNIPGLGPKEVAVKFKSLKKVYMEELKKVEESKANGADALSIYVPSLYWFPTMQALLGPRNQFQTAGTCVPGPVKQEDDEDDPDDPAPKESEFRSENEDFGDNDPISPACQTNLEQGDQSSSLNRDDKSCSVLPDESEPGCGSLSELELPEVPERPGGIMADTLDHFGRYVASILRELPYNRSYSLQRKFINEAIAARQVYEKEHPKELHQDEGDQDTKAPTEPPKAVETTVCLPVSPGTASADRSRKRRRKNNSSETLMSNEPTSSVYIKEEVLDVAEDETTKLPSPEQEPVRADEDDTSMEFEEEVKREYDGSGFEVVYCDSESSQASAPGGSSAGIQTKGSREQVAGGFQAPKKTNGKFTCNMCSIKFPSYGEFWDHAREKHADHTVDDCLADSSFLEPEEVTPNLIPAEHGCKHLPGVNKRKCAVCGKKSGNWCPACNVGVHAKCYLKLDHYFRPNRRDNIHINKRIFPTSIQPRAPPVPPEGPANLPSSISSKLALILVKSNQPKPPPSGQH